jgi:NADH-quinone oxidoreductase subunit E/NADP-reducing hydrogenase subunit HndA
MNKKDAQALTYSAKNLPKEKFDELGDYIETLETLKGSLISVLHRAQAIFGFLPMEVQTFVARKLDIPSAEVFGVVSFYSYFSMLPRGEHIVSVCMGTACFVRGAEDILHDIEADLGIKTGETTADGMFTLKDIRCVGACGLAPVVMVDEKIYGRITRDDVKGILDNYR